MTFARSTEYLVVGSSDVLYFLLVINDVTDDICDG